MVRGVSPGCIRVILRQYVGIGLLASCAVLGVACSSSKTTSDEQRVPVHLVRGRVLVSGKPASGALVLFIPNHEPNPPKDPRPRGEVAADGAFALSTYEAEDGAPAGEYIVSVTWPGGVLPDGREEPPDKLLGRYDGRAKSKLRATIKEGPNELPPFNL